MRSNTSALTLLALFMAAPAGAQVQLDEILVNFRFPSDALRHYRLDGTLVAEATTGSGTRWSGAAITARGQWVTVYHSGAPRQIALFDPSGTEASVIPSPEIGSNLGDVAVFADGTLVASDYTGPLELYSPTGAYQGSITGGGMTGALGLLVDGGDELWVTSFDVQRIWHFARDGSLLGSFDTGSLAVGDLDVAPDGTLWTIARENGRVRAYTPAGAVLASFPTLAGSAAHGIAVAPDGTLWVTGYDATQLYNYDTGGLLLGQFAIPPHAYFITIPKSPIGSRYCSPAVANSTGVPGRIRATGSSLVAMNDVTLIAEDLPPGEFGYFLASRAQGFVHPLGSQGILCLSGNIGRFNRPTDIIQGPMGCIAADLDSIPVNPPIAVLPGDTWNFQCWFRDRNPDPTSNFTDAVSVTFETTGDPAVQFPVTLLSQVEETVQLSVTVTLSQASSQDVTVPYTTGGSATYNVDWRVEEPNPMVIPAGETAYEMTIIVAEDTEQEGVETGVVTLGTPTGGVLGTAPEFTLTIVDDD